MTTNDTSFTAGRNALLEDQLNTLYEVSQVLSRSLNLRETLAEVLELLHERGGLNHGMVSLLDPESGELEVYALHKGGVRPFEKIRYRQGEGVVGAILAEGRTRIVPRLADEPRFLDRLQIYQSDLPFIGVPIRIGSGDPVGVFAAQPPERRHLLAEQARFLEMVANLIGQSVRLAQKVQDAERALRDERDTLRRQVKGEHGFSNMVGHTKAMRHVFDMVRQVAKWNTTVLIRGESGTGKELVANAIHYNSSRAAGTFVKLNCAALPDNLLESELFGHEKGAFTGAVSQRKGRFEQADGGTLFLDEIGEISPAFQAKLLRVLQEGEFERIGGNRTLKVDVRIIAATNRHLEESVKQGEFREDLYYRLNVMPIRMPSLRDRLEDIPDLANFLLKKIGNKQGRTVEINGNAIRVLMCHDWPGNVRELENTLERAAVMSTEGRIDTQALALSGLEEKHVPQAKPVAAVPESEEDEDFGHEPDEELPEGMDLDERARVVAALEEAGWVQAKAARLLNMTPRQIAYRIQIYNIKLRQI